MAYANGTASSPVNLLTTLAAWLVSIGWHSDTSQAEGAGWWATLDKGGMFINIRALMNERGFIVQSAAGYGIALFCGTGFSGGSWVAQLGGPLDVGANPTGVGVSLPAGAIQNYYFFSDPAGTNIAVVIEATPGQFWAFGWGQLNQAGAITGGPYFFGSFSANTTGESGGLPTTCACPCAHSDFQGASNAFLRVDVDSFVGKWLSMGDSTSVAAGYTGKSAASPVGDAFAMRNEIAHYGGNNVGVIQELATSEIDGRANLLPLRLWAARDGGGYSPVGTVPFVFYTNGVGKGYSNAEEVALGPTTYKMFPNFAVVKQ